MFIGVTHQVTNVYLDKHNFHLCGISTHHFLITFDVSCVPVCVCADSVCIPRCCVCVCLCVRFRNQHNKLCVAVPRGGTKCSMNTPYLTWYVTCAKFGKYTDRNNNIVKIVTEIRAHLRPLRNYRNYYSSPNPPHKTLLLLSRE